MSKMTTEEYLKLTKKSIGNWPDKPKKSKPVKEKLSTKEALRAMGEYFEWDKKSVDFVIKQWELTGII
jgi:hypothetical protein